MRKFDAPPQASVQWVSQSGQIEGMQLSIRRFEVSSMSVQDVLQYYHNKWKERAAETEMPPWKMIGTVAGKEYWNVQVQPRSGGGAWGYLSISDLPDVLKKKKPFGSEANSRNRFPAMAGSQIINDFQQKDVGKKGRTLLIKNDFSVSSNANYYRNYYQSRGYHVTTDQSDIRTGSYVMIFNKLNQSVSLAINQVDGQTNVVANEVTGGL